MYPSLNAYHQHAQTSSLLKCISSTLGLPYAVPPDLCSLVTRAAYAEVQARALSFCVRSRILPPAILAMLGGFPPSFNHGRRLCKIFRAEWHRQAGFYRDWLYASIFCDDDVRRARRRWWEHSRLLTHSTETFWHSVLDALRPLASRKVAHSEDRLHAIGDADVPEDVHRILCLGPKFAVQPRKDPAELLTCVRDVAQMAPVEEREACVSQGVKVLSCGGHERTGDRIGRVAASLRERRLCVLPADKEGGFVVLSQGVYRDKACAAVCAVFNPIRRVSLKKVKLRAKQMCKDLNLENVAKKINGADGDCLEMFFTAKTHKDDCPFRVIVSESGTWQKCVAEFLQNSLRLLNVADPFLTKDSSDVINFLNGADGQCLTAFSVDIKDLFYSLPHEGLLRSVEAAIDEHGTVLFSNACGVSVARFLELLSFYLRSTFVQFDNNIYLQKQGVCIGSCIAPILSDLFLARCDKAFAARVGDLGVLKVFRYVDDFLVFLDRSLLVPAASSQVDCRFDCSNPAVSCILASFNEYYRPLTFTTEFPAQGNIRFLDLRLHFKAEHVCWVYEPRANKPPLRYSSAHSKLVKRSIVRSFLSCALSKSCAHLLDEGLSKQVARLEAANYPKHIIISVAEGLHRQKKLTSRMSDEQRADYVRERKEEREKRKVAVIPYFHKVSHNLKKVGQRSGVNVVFTAPNKLLRLSVMSCPMRKPKPGCATAHKDPFVACTRNVVYKIPLSCGKYYVGQTGRCLNVRLAEHSNKVESIAIDGHLAAHCRKCDANAPCFPLFERTVVVYRHRNKITREIVEAAEIARAGEECVSTPSIFLSRKELEFLGIVVT
ncbi:uncharacterized protein [Dermacentor albipictus]|uniref:uncharacterized protein n=1 Tax=Dermacentor albipictus TaxID=60249 RepID=UPI0031FD54C4